MTKTSKLLVRSAPNPRANMDARARRIAHEIVLNIATEAPKNLEIAISEQVARVMGDPAEKARVGNDERLLANVMKYVREELEKLKGGRL